MTFSFLLCILLYISVTVRLLERLLRAVSDLANLTTDGSVLSIPSIGALLDTLQAYRAECRGSESAYSSLPQVALVCA